MMKYVIMCGGDNHGLEKQRQLFEVNGERLVERTIRLLRKNGVRPVYISTTWNDNFDYLKDKVKIIHKKMDDNWCDGFIRHAADADEEGVCYIFGDVYYSEEAIKTIVETETDDIEFFASSPPFSKYFVKEWAEPFAFKVVNVDKFFDSIDKVKKYHKEGKFRRHPIAWELWQVIKDGELNVIDYYNYTTINDYTCDVDVPEDIEYIEKAVKQYNEDIKNE